MSKLVIFFIVSLIIIIIAITKVQISFEFKRQKATRAFNVFLILNNYLFKIRIKIFNKKLNLFLNDFLEKGSRMLRSNWMEMIIRVISAWRKGATRRLESSKLLKLARKGVIIKHINLDVLFGTGDAGKTAIIVGRMWTLAGVGATILQNNFTTNEKKINIKPDFNNKILNIYLTCIFEIKTVYIIIGSIYLLLKYISNKLKNKFLGGDIIGRTSN